VPRQAGAGGVGAHALRIVGRQEQLAGGGEVQRCVAADGAHHLHARAFAVGALHVDDLVALAHAEVHGLLDQLVQLAHRGHGCVAHGQASLDEVAQLQQAHAEPVAARFRPVDEAADGQVVEDAVRGGRVQARLLADFLQRDGLLARGQDIDQLEHALQHLDAGLGRHVRMAFLHGDGRGSQKPAILRNENVRCGMRMKRAASACPASAGSSHF